MSSTGKSVPIIKCEHEEDDELCEYRCGYHRLKRDNQNLITKIKRYENPEPSTTQVLELRISAVFTPTDDHMGSTIPAKKRGQALTDAHGWLHTVWDKIPEGSSVTLIFGDKLITDTLKQE